METNLPQSEDAVNRDGSQKIPYDPNSVFKNKNIHYFGDDDRIKIQYKEFTTAKGKRKWINSAIVVVVFLVIEALIIANYPPARSFVVAFFSLKG